MFVYEYEVLKCSLKGFGIFNGNILTITGFQEIIDKRAKKGWRYTGYIPSKQRGSGYIEEITLIFEKKNSL